MLHKLALGVVAALCVGRGSQWVQGRRLWSVEMEVLVNGGWQRGSLWGSSLCAVPVWR